MKERPIIFSTESVRAILAGNKTQTRRVIDPQPLTQAVSAGELHSSGKDNGLWWWLDAKSLLDAGTVGNEFRCPYGVSSETLWVREAWGVHQSFDNLTPELIYAAMNGDTVGCVDYKAHPRNEGWTGYWRNAMFMPRWASRITLEITDVRVQRVQEISEEDAIAEGAITATAENVRKWGYDQTKRMAYADLWDSINAKRGYPWQNNPWVWAITFRRIV